MLFYFSKLIFNAIFALENIHLNFYYMKRKDFVQRMRDIKKHVRLIDASFVSGYNYPDDSRMINLVNELECLAAELRADLTLMGFDKDLIS